MWVVLSRPFTQEMIAAGAHLPPELQVFLEEFISLCWSLAGWPEQAPSPINSLKGLATRYLEMTTDFSARSLISLLKVMGHKGLLTPCHVTALRSQSAATGAHSPGPCQNSHVHAINLA